MTLPFSIITPTYVSLPRKVGKFTITFYLNAMIIGVRNYDIFLGPKAKTMR
jgi:hypothetical protein